MDADPIAIIGMGCRLPGGVRSPEDLWQLVSEGRSGWKTVPEDRWNAESFYHADHTAVESWNAKSGYFLDQDVTEFDSRFFGFSAHEADITDPQQRILLETTFEALENAGIPIEGLKGSDTSVFVAVFARDYDRMGYKDLEKISRYHIGGTGEAILSNRLSYFFDLKGGSMTLDTGCSGSLVAVHEACMTLRTGQSRMAIVGGTELLLHPDQFVSMSAGGMLNSEGKCFTFDSRGAGYGKGEGVGTVILKRLSHAMEDGDPIHAVILNSGINQDGKTNGITLPNPDSQAALIKSVYEAVGLDPCKTLYVEAHGTGTQVGDQAEISSISRTFCASKREHDLYVGSVKSNIGHLEAASGVAGLIKAVMVLKKQRIPPNLNFIEPKPGLNLEERQIRASLPFQVPLELTPLAYPGHKGPERVSLNSFGYGGTNCHMILETPRHGVAHDSASDIKNSHENRQNDSPQTHGNTNGVANGVTNGAAATNGISIQSSTPREADVSQPGQTNGDLDGNHSQEHSDSESTVIEDPIESIQNAPLLFPLTASSEGAIEAMAARLAQWLTNKEITYSALRDLSYTLSCRRSTFRWRNFVVASTSEELKEELAIAKPKTKMASSTNLAFVFTGQGAQWPAMGRELIRLSTVFKESLIESERLLKQFGCEWSLLQELGKSDSESRINQSEISQPATTAVQVALVDLLADFGISPTYVVGHSSGEIAAAYAAGALSRQDAIKSSFLRGRFSAMAKNLNSLPGSMLAAGCGEETILQMLKMANIDAEKGQIKVACINSPDSVTLSGDEPAIDDLHKVLFTGGISARKLKVETAYHSHHMQKIADSYSDSLQDICPMEPRKGVRFFSSVSGTIKKANFGPSYWTENLVSQVRFSDALAALVSDMAKSSSTRDAANLLIEIGPHSALQGPIRQVLARVPDYKYSYTSPLIRGKDAARTVLSAASRVFELRPSFNLERILDMQGKKSAYHVIADLNPYPWDSSKHWYESRLSKEHRLRQFPYHDLAGLFDVTSNIHEPRWRYHLSVERLPWLKHHVVDGLVIFPGTGYTCMVLEASKQLVQLRYPGATIERFTAKNMGASRPIILPAERHDGPTAEIEVQLVMSRSISSEDSQWNSIRILSCQPDGSWVLNATGMIRFDLAPNTKIENIGWARDETNSVEAEAFKALERIQAVSHEKLDIEEMYAGQKLAGNDYGPTFKLLTEAHIGGTVGYATLTIPDISQWMPHSFFQPHLVHPTTLDATNHVMATIFHRVCSISPIMPVNTENQSVYTNITNKPGDELLIVVEFTRESKGAGRGDNWIFQRNHETGGLTLVSTMKSMQVRAIGEAIYDTENRPFHRKMNYQMDWKDDVDLLTQSDFRQLMSSAVPDSDASPDTQKRSEIHEKAAVIYLEEAMGTLANNSDESTALPYLGKFSNWIRDFSKSDLYTQLFLQLSSDEKDVILRSSASSGVEGQMIARIGKALPAILRSEVDARDIMTEDGLLDQFTSNGPFETSYAQLAKLSELLAYKNPHMNIIEVGAGTGSATSSVFQGLDHQGRHLFQRYCYTDISSDVFEQAKTKLNLRSQLIEFKVLDITKDPADQGFEAHDYDLVIASNVLSAMPSIADSMTNIRKLLKPGGRLVLLEMTRPTTSMSMIMGALPEWWAFNDNRKNSPILSKDEWTDRLLQSSFAGIEFESTDNNGPRLITAKAVEAEAPQAPPPPSNPVRIVHSSSSPLVQSIGEALASAIEATGLSCSSSSWESLPTTTSESTTFHVVLDSTSAPILASPPSEVFETIKALATTARHVLWVSFQETEDGGAVPFKGLITGLARVMRRENEDVQFITLNVEDVLSQCDSSVIEAIMKVADSCLWPKSDEERSMEVEYSLSGGRLRVPRLDVDSKFNHWADRINGQGQLETCVYRNATRPLKLEVESPGLLSSLRFVPDNTPSLPLGDDEIQIESKAFGVNFRDVFIALGQMPPALPMAGEVAGVVTAVGPGKFVQDTYKVGDRVFGLRGQPFSSHTRLKGLEARVLPDSVSWTEAASIPIVFATVYYSFVHLARLEAGQKVLIHAASGGVGQAAMQYAQHVGAEVFATVGSADKRQMIMDEYGIPESHIFSSRAPPDSLKRGIMKMTANKGVDVVLNSLAGEMLVESLECLAPLGIHIELGKADIYKKSLLTMVPFDKQLTFASVDLLVFADERPRACFEILGKVLDLVDKGILHAVRPLNVMPISQLEPAFRLIAERKHVGKVVLEVDDDSKVMAALPPPRRLNLDANGTYVIAGGLGDVGRRLSHQLASCGAGHIVTLSRRTLEKAAQHRFEQEIEQLGGKLHVVKCDITDRNSVQTVLQMCQRSLPPVKGVIHGGMVLRDHPLVHMSVEDWHTSLGPKVTGTIHLDEAFSSPHLDFFITLSSISCIVGKTGQANYSAANAFQDAFVQERAGKSRTRYTSLNLPAIDGSDAITSLPANQQELMRNVSILMTFDELYQVLEYAMDHSVAADSQSQLVMGFDGQSMLAAQDDASLLNPLFSMVPRVQSEGEDGLGGVGAKRDVEAALRKIKSIDEAVELITEEILDKFVIFLNLERGDINPDQPLAAFGLDSLVSIELKNWMVRTFKVTLQSSELISAPSVPHLAKTLAVRSRIISDELRGEPIQEDNTDHKEDGLPAEQVDEQQPQQGHGFDCCRFATTVPRLPVPDFDDAMRDHMENISHFASTPEELEGFRAAMAEFTAPNGTARRMYTKIQEIDRDPSVEDWASKYLAKHIHLNWRQGLQFTNIMALHHPSRIPHTQAERAAVVATAAFKYKQDIDQGLTENQIIMGIPMCNHDEKWLFNTYRLPGNGCDESRKYTGDYFVVLRRGRVFRVNLEGQTQDSFVMVKHMMQHIIDTVQDEGSWAGMLTSDSRNSWSRKREDLLALHPQNAEYLQTIEAAAFVINIDETSPDTYTEQVKQVKLGNGFNRWNDKGLQFVIPANGTSAVIVEHSRIDGTTLIPLHERIRDAIAAYQPTTSNGANGNHSNTPRLEEVCLITSPEIDDHIQILRQRWLELTAPRDFISHTIKSLGGDFLASRGMPIKSIIDVTAQLATSLYFGSLPPNWQPTMLGHFHKGRHDMVQIGSKDVVAFCDAAQDETLPAARRRDLMLQAARDINARLKAGSSGKGYFRLYNVIEEMWPTDEPRAALFQDPVQMRTLGFTLVTNFNHNSTADAITTPTNPNAVRIKYAIREKNVTFSINCPTGRVEEMLKCVNDAATIVRSLILSQ